MKAKTVKETISEGVADKYAEREFSIEDTTPDLYRKSLERQLSRETEVIAQEGDWKLIKNPKSIDLTSEGSRGVITANGDLYMENKSTKIHHDLLKILFAKGILKGEFSKRWSKQLPSETGFLTVQRFKATDHIAIGESNRIIYNKEDFDNYFEIYKDFMDRARKVNPNLSFQDKLVGLKFANLKESSNNHENLSYFKNERDHFMKL